MHIPSSWMAFWQSIWNSFHHLFQHPSCLSGTCFEYGPSSGPDTEQLSPLLRSTLPIILPTRLSSLEVSGTSKCLERAPHQLQPPALGVGQPNCPVFPRWNTYTHVVRKFRRKRKQKPWVSRELSRCHRGPHANPTHVLIGFGHWSPPVPSVKFIEL